MTKDKVLNNIKEYVYYCYIVCMPFLIPSFFTNKFNLPYLLGLSSIFLGVGILFIITSKEMNTKLKLAVKKLRWFIFYFIATSIVSIIMLIVLSFGNNFIKAGYVAVLKQICFNAYSLIIIFYNYLMIKEVGLNKILKILWIESIVCLAICFLQFLCVEFKFFVKIYDFVNFLKILPEGKYYNKLSRITGFGYEPSTFSNFLIFISLPIFLSAIINKRKLILNSILSCLVVIFAYFTKSTAVYVCLFIELAIFLICLFAKFFRTNKKVFMISFCGFIIFALGVIFVTRNELFKLIFKIFDLKNESTVYRYSTIYNDILCFLKYPIIGVGNGLQGIFYNEHIKFSVFSETESLEIVHAIKGSFGLVSGGAFIPSAISGYGLVGIILIYQIIKNSYKNIKNYKFYNLLYLFALIPLFIGGCVAYELSFNYLALFLIIIPFVVNDDKTLNNDKNKKEKD